MEARVGGLAGEHELGRSNLSMLQPTGVPGIKEVVPFGRVGSAGLS